MREIRIRKVKVRPRVAIVFLFNRNAFYDRSKVFKRPFTKGTTAAVTLPITGQFDCELTENKQALTANQSIILKCNMSPAPNPWGVETYEINKTKEIALRFVY